MSSHPEAGLASLSLVTAARQHDDSYSDYWRRFWDAPPRTYAGVSVGERDRIDAVVSLLPSDVGMILEVGCGDGLVANRLRDLGYNVVGSDIEAGALDHLDVPTRVGSIDALPAEDLEFDCVLAADVLEHLPSKTFELARAELARVARRYIVVNSPHEERLVIAQTQCGHCATAFHSSRHTRSISLAEARDWFVDFDLETSKLCGERVRPRQVWLQRLGQFAGHWYVAPAAVCPNCWYPADTRRGSSLVRFSFGAAHRLVGLFTHPRSTEFAALYRRRVL
jgi:SAM-dependent methyltransferase